MFCYAFLEFIFLNIYISADISEYRIFKSPNICIGIGLKNPISSGSSYYGSVSPLNKRLTKRPLDAALMAPPVEPKGKVDFIEEKTFPPTLIRCIGCDTECPQIQRQPIPLYPNSPPNGKQADDFLKYNLPGCLNRKGCLYFPHFFSQTLLWDYLNWSPFKSKSQALVFHLAKYESISDRAQMLSELQPLMRIYVVQRQSQAASITTLFASDMSFDYLCHLPEPIPG